MRPQIISFNCNLKNRAGKLISSTYNREVLNIVDESKPGLLSALAKQLQNIKAGEKRNISLAAEDAYGLYDLNKIVLFPRKKLPDTARKGQSICIIGKSGKEHLYLVHDVLDDFVRLDGNHPLAGQDLVFEIEALDARYATQDEIDGFSETNEKSLLH